MRTHNIAYGTGWLARKSPLANARGRKTESGALDRDDGQEVDAQEGFAGAFGRHQFVSPQHFGGGDVQRINGRKAKGAGDSEGRWANASCGLAHSLTAAKKLS